MFRQTKFKNHQCHRADGTYFGLQPGKLMTRSCVVGVSFMRAMRIIFFTFCVALTLIPFRVVVANDERTEDRTGQLQHFESKIRPILATHCYECHSSAGVSESGLALDSREGIRRGGDRGSAVVPGKPKQSLLLRAISHSNPHLKMPPNRARLPDSVLADFRKWVQDGAVDPRDEPDSGTTIKRVTADEFWSFQPVNRPTVPAVDDKWARTNVDRFVLQRLQQDDMKPNGDASLNVVIRRIWFDLTGLPPSIDEWKAFRRNADQHGFEEALAKQIDELQQRTAFGERWGRHWLDVARFAESSGKEANISFPYAWRYRDYVIDAFNSDIPYDRFLTEQLAGDLLPYRDDTERTRLLIATGFLALGPKNLDAMDERQFAADIIDEQIDATTRVFMASSVACARCHDHKFDPYSMTDYYALAGIFKSTRTYFGTAVSPANRNGGDPLVLPRLKTTPILHKSMSASRVEKLKAERAALQRERFEKGAAFTLRDALRVLWRTGGIDGQLEKVDSAGRALPLAMGVLDQREPDDAEFLQRGDINRSEAKVARAFPTAFRLTETTSIPPKQSGRLQLARWLTRHDHPLTARVAVNRIWSHLFGHGLVRSVDDFGSTGQRPTHPALLDYLAAEFVEDGWSVKRLIRRLMMSHVYLQSSRHRPDAFEKDPENKLLWRMPHRRLEAEAIRDAMLSVSGKLDLQRPVASLVGRIIGDRPISLVGLDKRLPQDLDGAVHRSVYLPVMRDRLPDVLDVFDFAEPSLVTGRRNQTNVPTQALYMMNSPFVTKHAIALAARLRADAENDEERVRLAFQLCFSRAPTNNEVQRSLQYLTTADAEVKSGDDRLPGFCQTLFCTVEFRVLD